MTTAPPVVAAKDLTAGYGSIPAIRGVSLELVRGTVTALLGANGAGKTTTVLALAGALKPMSGSIEVDGTSTRAPLHRRVHAGTALVTDDRTVFMDLTVDENLRIGKSEPELALELFPELRPHVRRKVGLLSGGQQQMLALGRALASEPRALLIDELSLGLAPVIAERLFEAVREAANRGIAVLLVEQYARSALGLADRAHVLVRGEMALSGSGSDLLGRIGEIENAYLS